MTTKLTLSIDEKIVKKAKRVALRKGTSVSKLFEEYLKGIQEKEEENPLEAIKAILKKHRSKIPLPSDGNYAKMVNEWRWEEYMKKTSKK
jgi:hypothetical protein